MTLGRTNGALGAISVAGNAPGNMVDMIALKAVGCTPGSDTRGDAGIWE
jgi:hypothetical protein